MSLFKFLHNSENGLVFSSGKLVGLPTYLLSQFELDIAIVYFGVILSLMEDKCG